jgi:hypothetical protein
MVQSIEQKDEPSRMPTLGCTLRVPTASCDPLSYGVDLDDGGAKGLSEDHSLEHLSAPVRRVSDPDKLRLHYQP